MKKHPKDKQMANVYASAKCAVETDAAIEKLIGETPVNKFRINSLDELEDIISKCDV